MKTKIYVDWKNKIIYSEREFNTNRKNYAINFEDEEFENWLDYNYSQFELYNIGMNQSMFLVEEEWNKFLEGEMQDYDKDFECFIIETDEKE